MVHGLREIVRVSAARVTLDIDPRQQKFLHRRGHGFQNEVILLLNGLVHHAGHILTESVAPFFHLGQAESDFLIHRTQLIKGGLIGVNLLDQFPQLFQQGRSGENLLDLRCARADLSDQVVHLGRAVRGFLQLIPQDGEPGFHQRGLRLITSQALPRRFAELAEIGGSSLQTTVADVRYDKQGGNRCAKSAKKLRTNGRDKHDSSCSGLCNNTS